MSALAARTPPETVIEPVVVRNGRPLNNWTVAFPSEQLRLTGTVYDLPALSVVIEDGLDCERELNLVEQALTVASRHTLPVLLIICDRPYPEATATGGCFGVRYDGWPSNLPGKMFGIVCCFGSAQGWNFNTRDLRFHTLCHELGHGLHPACDSDSERLSEVIDLWRSAQRDDARRSKALVKADISFSVGNPTPFSWPLQVAVSGKGFVSRLAENPLDGSGSELMMLQEDIAESYALLLRERLVGGVRLCHFQGSGLDEKELQLLPRDLREPVRAGELVPFSKLFPARAKLLEVFERNPARYGRMAVGRSAYDFGLI